MGEEETLSFTLASAGEHSINSASESQEALDAVAIVITPGPAAILSNRNTSGDRKPDRVV
jgi:hypothetical protein